MNSSYKRSSSPQRKRTRKGLALFTPDRTLVEKKRRIHENFSYFQSQLPFIEKDTATVRILGIIGKALDHPEFFETVDFFAGKIRGSKSS